jgi:hypothetical protein
MVEDREGNMSLVIEHMKTCQSTEGYKNSCHFITKQQNSIQNLTAAFHKITSDSSSIILVITGITYS